MPTISTRIINTPTNMPKQVNPPVINITYPSDGQIITFTGSSQQLCIVDQPSGGNTTGLQRKVNINNGGWSSYTPISTLCFQPQDGQNSLQLQYKNGAGDESGIYQRQFMFHQNQNITVSLNGQAYNDQNCNNSKDTGEQGVGRVNITIMETSGKVDGQVSTDGNGNYNFSETIAPDASVTLQPNRVDHTYNWNSPSPVTLNATNKSATLDIAIMPSTGCH